jgi:hypothetical protein
MRHEAGPAFDQEAAEDLGRVAADAGLDQVAGEVGARDQVGVADVLQRAFVRAVDADLGQLGGHLAGPLLATAARRCEAEAQRLVVGVEAETHDVHRDPGEGDRDLGTGEVRQAEVAGRGARSLLAAELVVVGEGPELDAVRLGTGGERFRLERPVGDLGVAVQVGVHRGKRVRHIIGACTATRCRR